MSEAGRSAEPPLMAPPGQDVSQDGGAKNAVAPSGLMSPPRAQGSRVQGSRAQGGVQGGKAKKDEPAAEPGGESKGESAGPDDQNGSVSSPSEPSAAKSVEQSDVPFPADGIAASPANPDGDGGAERLGAALNGKLDSGRQAMRQAVSATNNWFAARAAKNALADGEDQAAPAAAPAASPAASASAAAKSAPAAQPYGAPPYSPPGAPSYQAPQPYAAAPRTSAAPRASAAPMPGHLPPGHLPPARPSAGQDRSRGTRRDRAAVRRSRRQAHLTVARVEPWSVMKFSFVVSVVAFVILFVAVAVLYMVLSGLGVFTSLQHTVSTITSSQNSTGTNISSWFSASRILGYTAMLGALNIVLITAMCTIGAVIYNLIAHTIGGVEVTLRESD